MFNCISRVVKHFHQIFFLNCIPRSAVARSEKIIITKIIIIIIIILMIMMMMTSPSRFPKTESVVSAAPGQRLGFELLLLSSRPPVDDDDEKDGEDEEDDDDKDVDVNVSALNSYIKIR